MKKSSSSAYLVDIRRLEVDEEVVSGNDPRRQPHSKPEETQYRA